MRVAIATALTLAMLSPALASVRVIDGDTVDVDGTRIRILSIDTPETFQSRCDNELVLGLKAKARLTELLGSGEVSYTHPTVSTALAERWRLVYAGEVSVGDVLLKEGYALPYVPGPEAKAKRLATWCPTGK